ncbi:uncharacterized protein [Clytia hemisphaerica]|uniref:uncharacterized protein n=1 Tax=Clytia hemisphaerica TaxID=252671 RepID=UPI0034D5462E
MSSESEGSAKVVSFLETLDVEEHVIDNFKKEKLDIEAILHATDEILKKNGLTADGDIIRMRVFCSKADNNERKYELKSYLQNNKSKRQSKQEESPKTSSKRLHLSWEHFDRQKNKFAIVKAEKGGGSRSEKFSKDTTKQELFNYCVTIFWTGRRKEHFPNECHMIIADYKHDPIPDIYHGNPFTFGGYLDLYKMARPRIFFQTKPKIFSASLPIATPPSHHYRPESRRSLEAPEVLADTSQSSTSPNTTPNRPMNNSDLNARRALIEEQNKAYEEAL